MKYSDPHTILSLLLALLLISLQACTNDLSSTPNPEQEIDKEQVEKDIAAVEKLIEDAFQVIWSDLDHRRKDPWRCTVDGKRSGHKTR